MKMQAETKIWVLCNEARLCFSLLCLMTQLLAQGQSELTRTVFLHVFSKENTATISIQTEKVENDFPEIEPTVLFQSNEEVAKQDYDLTNAVLENFCKTYNAKLERTSTDTKQGYLLKIPVYNARSNLQLHANIPRRTRHVLVAHEIPGDAVFPQPVPAQ